MKSQLKRRDFLEIATTVAAVAFQSVDQGLATVPPDIPEVLYVEGDTIPDGKAVGDVKTAAIVTTPFDWTYNKARLEQGELAELNHNRLVSKLGLFFAYDTRNHALMPSHGQRTQVNAEVAGGPLGGDTEMYRLEIETAYYYPGLVDGHVWEVVGKLGIVDTFGASRRVPYFARFFLGGGDSRRDGGSRRGRRRPARRR